MNYTIGLISETLAPERKIAECVKRLGEEITEDYKNRGALVMVGVLKGAVVFLSDLVRCVDLPLSIDFLEVSSYGDEMETSGAVRIIKDFKEDIAGKNVLLVEDIIDTGLTIDYLLKLFSQRNPASMEVCCLLNKSSRRRIHVRVKYIGFEIPDKFVVGYGLDYGQLYRNLPDICVLKPEVYEF